MHDVLTTMRDPNPPGTTRALVAPNVSGSLPIAHRAPVSATGPVPRPSASPALLRRMVLAGWYGKKSGKGFYDWSDAANPKANKF